MQNTAPSRILITGGASGLGRALAEAFHAEGHRVCIADLNEQRGQDTLRVLGDEGDTAIYCRLDVRQAPQFQAVLEHLSNRWGGVDILINNAGVASGGPFDWLEDDDWRYVMDINFGGVLNGCRTYVPIARRQGGGCIINIASMAGLLNPPGMANYNVSKAAVVSLSETLAVELAPHNIKVLCVCPSFFRTNLAESMRTPDAATEEALAGLMENSSELAATDVANAILTAWKTGATYVLPHERANQAWEQKRRAPEDWLEANRPLADNIARKARRKTGQ